MEYGAMKAGAFLAIWSDVARNEETDYLHWLTREHVSERLSVDGFISGRVYRLLREDICRYLIHYELESPEVLASDAYLLRLNAPTPWSQRIMPILSNFSRGGGRVLVEGGNGQGGVLAAIKLDPRTEGIDRAMIDRLVARDRIIAVQLLETDIDKTAITTLEKSMRENDESFPGLLLIEGLDERAVADAARLCVRSDIDLYSKIFQL